MLVEAGPINFVSGINAGHFRFKDDEILFPIAELTHPSHRVKGFGFAYNTPADIIVNVLVFKPPDMFGQSCCIFGISCFETGLMISPSCFETSCC